MRINEALPVGGILSGRNSTVKVLDGASLPGTLLSGAMLTRYGDVDPIQQGGAMLTPGDQAPDFTGRDHNGNPVSLSALRGKTVVLWFFPKADTPG